MKELKRLTIFCGHYGSGKTNVAVNTAVMLREKYDKVTIADLDIVNPYFRTKDSDNLFREKNITLISSEYANSNLDIPALPAEIYSITSDKNSRVVMDIGGDDRGAVVLGRLAPEILAENDYDMLLVINCYRPLTDSPESVREILREIEAASGIHFTGIVNNSNLGRETTAKDILKSLSFAEEVSRETNLPIVMTTVERSLYDELHGKAENILPLDLQKKII